MTARRHTPADLGRLDLSLHDPRIAWAVTARASSEWGASYAASCACGPPAVFPRGGDEHGTWLASTEDRSPFLEVTFAARFTPRALIVCETCGPGGIASIRDRDTGRELYAAKPVALAPSRDARLLVVPLDPELPALRRARIELRKVGGDYQEIDAVGLLAEPLEALIRSPPAHGRARHRRYRPDEVTHLRMRGDHRIVWAARAKASSEWSDSYAAKAATGPPSVFPRGGDHERTWLSATGDRDAWIELEFDNDQPVYGVVVAETCGAGSTVRIHGEDGELLWQARHEASPAREARLLHVAIEAEPVLTRLRLHVSQAIDDYREIDAVALLTAPFEELAAPPPPPPIPGAPRGGFTMASGRLVGASPDRPVAHVVVRTAVDARVVSSAGPLRLVTAGGEEMALTLDETTVYGPPIRRRRGTWRALGRELPWLVEALGTDPPAPETEVEVLGRAISRSVEVHVAGIASRRADGGFRDAAGAPRALAVRALADVPLSRTDFPARGTATFRRDARPLEPLRAAPHPYDRWIAWSGGLALADLALFGGLAGALSAQLVGHAAWIALSVLAFATGALALSIALELTLRRAAPLVVERGASVSHNARPRLPRPIWSVVTTVLTLGLAAGFLSLAAIDAEAPAASLFFIALSLGGVHALVRLAMWAPEGIPALVAATSACVGTRREGLLVDDVSITEIHTERSEHLGTDHVVDAQGRTTSHDRYRTWVEREVRVSGEPALCFEDGTVTSGRAGTVVVPRPASRPTEGVVVARLEASFAPGDAAVACGPLGRGGRLHASTIVLGELAALRQAVLTTWTALAGLALVATSVALPFLLSTR